MGCGPPGRRRGPAGAAACTACPSSGRTSVTLYQRAGFVPCRGHRSGVPGPGGRPSPPGPVPADRAVRPPVGRDERHPPGGRPGRAGDWVHRGRDLRRRGAASPARRVADVGNLYVAADYRRRGVATWLLGQAADWLRLAQVTRLLDYASLETSPDGRDDAEYRSFLAASHSPSYPDQAQLDPEPGGCRTLRPRDSPSGAGGINAAGMNTECTPCCPPSRRVQPEHAYRFRSAR